MIWMERLRFAVAHTRVAQPLTFVGRSMTLSLSRVLSLLALAAAYIRAEQAFKVARDQTAAPEPSSMAYRSSRVCSRTPDGSRGVLVLKDLTKRRRQMVAFRALEIGRAHV